MAPRRSAERMEAESVDALMEALAGLANAYGVRAAVEESPDGDVSVELRDGRRLVVEVKAAAHADSARIAASLPTWSRQLRRRGEVVGVLVADSVPERTKRLLAEAGWGWLDRRGHLFVQGPGVLIDTPAALAPRTSHRAGSSPLRGRAGLAVAAALLLDPTEQARVRPLARRLRLAPSTVSETLAALRDGALVRSDGAPLVPELFWALADAWPRQAVAVASLPDDDSPLRLSFDRLDQPGWVLGGTAAAALWGAPAPRLADDPLDFYVPDEVEHRAAIRSLGEAAVWEQRAAGVAVAPVELMTAERHLQPGGGTPWPSCPLVHPLFAALDLAQDRARGAEILDDWSPPEPFTRVW